MEENDLENDAPDNEEEWGEEDPAVLAIEDGDEGEPSASNPPGNDADPDDDPGAPSSKANKNKSRERYSSSYSSVKHLPVS